MIEIKELREKEGGGGLSTIMCKLTHISTPIYINHHLKKITSIKSGTQLTKFSTKFIFCNKRMVYPGTCLQGTPFNASTSLGLKMGRLVSLWPQQNDELSPHVKTCINNGQYNMIPAAASSKSNRCLNCVSQCYTELCKIYLKTCHQNRYSMH